MSLYETLDIVADAYDPMLAFAVLLMSLRAARDGHYRTGVLVFAQAAAGLAVVYGAGAIDRATGLFARWHLDYSTHTAFALCMIAALAAGGLSRRVIGLIAGSFLAYALLMVYQAYHSVADILATAALAGPLLGGLLTLAKRSQAGR